MLKLLFPAAILAPVIMLAVPTGDVSPLPALNGASLASVSTNSALDSTAADCHSETLGVSFHDSYLESHSAEQLGEMFTAIPGCQPDFVRLTTFVAEARTEDDLSEATTRRTELALHIQALIGEDAAKTLTVATDMRTSVADPRERTHALVRLERRPATNADAVLAADNTSRVAPDVTPGSSGENGTISAALYN